MIGTYRAYYFYLHISTHIKIEIRKRRRERYSRLLPRHSMSSFRSKQANMSAYKRGERWVIVFHGNCIDGWMATFIAHTILVQRGTVRQYPVAPGQPGTWVVAEQVMRNAHVLLLDVSVPQETRDKWLANGALSVNCIDHHESAIEHWPADTCPIHVESCAALQTWHHFYPDMEVPAWLHNIDRVDRWDNPTDEDRSIREVLNVIAHKPVQRKFDEAFEMTRKFIETMSTPEGVAAIIAEGREILRKKDQSLFPVLGKGKVIKITPELQAQWNLPASWANVITYVIDNTDMSFDSTEAAHQTFTYFPEVNVFINYRRKTFLEKGDMTVEKTVYTYSARSRSFVLNEDGCVFKGHPTAAGASLILGEVAVLPFIK